MGRWMTEGRASKGLIPIYRFMEALSALEFSIFKNFLICFSSAEQSAATQR